MNILILLVALVVQDKPFPDTNQKPSIEAAKKRAAAENRRVLLLIGDNDSEPSRAAATMLKKNKELARLILYEYDVVLLGVKDAGGGLQDPLPQLHLQDSGGKDLFAGAAPAEAAAMIDLLKKHQAPPLNAKDVLAAAMKKAAEEKKRVLLTFGAPW